MKLSALSVLAASPLSPATVCGWLMFILVFQHLISYLFFSSLSEVLAPVGVRLSDVTVRTLDPHPAVPRLERSAAPHPHPHPCTHADTYPRTILHFLAWLGVT